MSGFWKTNATNFAIVGAVLFLRTPPLAANEAQCDHRIMWAEYDASEFARQIGDRSKTKVLLITANWTITTSFALCRSLLETEQFIRIVRENEISLVHADASSEKARKSILSDLFEITGRQHRTVPVVVVFPSGESRVPYFYDFSEKDRDHFYRILGAAPEMRKTRQR